jgi:signal transduction histidine kinase
VTLHVGMRGLRGRLTVSYVLVTVIAALAMSIAIAVVQTADGNASGGTPSAADVLQKSAAQAGASLSRQSSPDSVNVSVAQPIMTELARQFPGAPLAVAVFNDGGDIAGATACSPQQVVTESSAHCATDAAAALAPLLANHQALSLIAATANPTSNGVSGSGIVDGHGYLVAGIPASDKRSSGALVALFTGRPPAGSTPSAVSAFFTQWRTTASPTWLPLLLAVVLVGTLAGLLLSGHLIRRLHDLAATVRVWSRGELDSAADDTGHDELSSLATDLNHMAEQLRNLLAARTDIAKAQERHHVRRELHDGVKQELFAATMHLAAATTSLGQISPETQTHLADVQRSTQRAQRELSAIMDAAAPPMLADHDLPSALTGLAENFQRQTRIPLTVSIPADLSVDDGIQRTIYRITQEALTNIQRHAHARSAYLTITITDSVLELRIADDGVGIPLDVAPTAGAGLVGIRERVAVVGGALDITSDLRGTRLIARVPLDRDDIDSG